MRSLATDRFVRRMGMPAGVVNVAPSARRCEAFGPVIQRQILFHRCQENTANFVLRIQPGNIIRVLSGGIIYRHRIVPQRKASLYRNIDEPPEAYAEFFRDADEKKLLENLLGRLKTRPA